MSEQPDHNLLTAQLDEADAHINDLQAENSKLQAELEELTSERDRILIENKLAIEDAELVRSFKRTNYAPLIEELFEKPAKRLRRQTLLMLVLAITITLGSTYALFGYLLLQNNQAINTELTRLHSNLDLLQAQATPATPVVESAPEVKTEAEAVEQTASLEPEATPAPVVEEVQAAPSDDVVDTNTSEPAAQPKLDPRAQLIAQQADKIIGFIRSVEQRPDFPQGYQSDRSELTQLYLIVMQHFNNEFLSYDAYLQAMERLEVDASIRPEAAADIAIIDRDFLQALYSAYLITEAKKAKGWRYRDLDRRFAAYYDPSSPYQIGAWQIVNKSQDYTVLPKVFAANIYRLNQQLIANNQEANSVLPEQIFYTAYTEASKNNAVKNLFNNEQLINQDGALSLNATRYPLPLNKEMIYKVQEQLAEQGFIAKGIINGIAGPKTAQAVQAYREKNQLRQANIIDLELVKSLGLTATYSDLAIEPL